MKKTDSSQAPNNDASEPSDRRHAQVTRIDSVRACFDYLRRIICVSFDEFSVGEEDVVPRMQDSFLRYVSSSPPLQAERTTRPTMESHALDSTPPGAAQRFLSSYRFVSVSRERSLFPYVGHPQTPTGADYRCRMFDVDDFGYSDGYFSSHFRRPDQQHFNSFSGPRVDAYRPDMAEVNLTGTSPCNSRRTAYMSQAFLHQPMEEPDIPWRENNDSNMFESHDFMELEYRNLQREADWIQRGTASSRLSSPNQAHNVTGTKHPPSKTSKPRSIGLHLNSVGNTSSTGRSQKQASTTSSRQEEMKEESILESLRQSLPIIPQEELLKNSEKLKLGPELVKKSKGSKSNPEKIRRIVPPIEKYENKQCSCKKTQCLKLYCDCFNLGIYCEEDCGCHSCLNQHDFEDSIKIIRRSIGTRNPNAFTSKITPPVPGSAAANVGNGGQPTTSAARHRKGCNCRKSHCAKKYCECFTAGVGCCNECRCDNCKNRYGRKEGGAFVTESDTDGDEGLEARINTVMGGLAKNDNPTQEDLDFPSLTMPFPFPGNGTNWSDPLLQPNPFPMNTPHHISPGNGGFLPNSPWSWPNTPGLEIENRFPGSESYSSMNGLVSNSPDGLNPRRRLQFPFEPSLPQPPPSRDSQNRSQEKQD